MEERTGPAEAARRAGSEKPVQPDRGTLATDVVIAANPGFEVQENAAVRELEAGRTGVTIEIRGAASR